MSVAGALQLFSERTFLLGVLVAAALQASHAMYYAFGTLSFTRAGSTVTAPNCSHQHFISNISSIYISASVACNVLRLWNGSQTAPHL
jgi:uncharacterized membrane protein